MDTTTTNHKEPKMPTQNSARAASFYEITNACHKIHSLLGNLRRDILDGASASSNSPLDGTIRRACSTFFDDWFEELKRAHSEHFTGEELLEIYRGVTDEG